MMPDLPTSRITTCTFLFKSIRSAPSKPDTSRRAGTLVLPELDQHAVTGCHHVRILDDDMGVGCDLLDGSS